MITESAKIYDAIYNLEKKIKAQGRITNARDEEHLQKLKTLLIETVKKERGGK